MILVPVRRRRLLFIERQRYIERRPLAFDRFEPDTSCVTLDQFPAQVQAEARPLDVIHLSIVCAHEAAEDVPPLAFRNAYTLILNAEEGVTLIFIFIECDGDEATLRTVFDSVIDQVAENLLDTAMVYVTHEVFSHHVKNQTMVLRCHLETR